MTKKISKASIAETLRQIEDLGNSFETTESTPMSFEAALEELNNIVK